MERIAQYHKGRYRLALSLFKQEAGPCMAVSFAALLPIAVQWSIAENLLQLEGFHSIFFWIQLLLQIALLLFMTGPVLLGIGRWFYLLPLKRVAVEELFYYFEDKQQYQRAVLFTLHMAGRVLFWILSCVLTWWFFDMLLTQFRTELIAMTILYSILLVLQGLLVVIFAGGLLYHAFRYFLAPFLLFEHEQLSAATCMRYSYDLMKDRRVDVMMLIMSLFPLYLICPLVVPIFFTIPYLSLLCSYRSRELLEQSQYES